MYSKPVMMNEVFSAVPAKSEDVVFAHDLTHSNMSSYYALLNRSWNRSLFETSWPETENYRLQISDNTIGFLRLSASENTLYIRDIQILPLYQNCGAGSFAIQFAQSLAANRNIPILQLRVFIQNPAKSLYYRLGFTDVSNDGNILTLESQLSDNVCPI